MVMCLDELNVERAIIVLRHLDTAQTESRMIVDCGHTMQWVDFASISR